MADSWRHTGLAGLQHWLETAQHQAPGTRHRQPDTGHQAPGTRRRPPGTRYRHQEQATRHQALSRPGAQPGWRDQLVRRYLARSHSPNRSRQCVGWYKHGHKEAPEKLRGLCWGRHVQSEIIKDRFRANWKYSRPQPRMSGNQAIAFETTASNLPQILILQMEFHSAQKWPLIISLRTPLPLPGPA
jgi:hypothetical protein